MAEQPPPYPTTSGTSKHYPSQTTENAAQFKPGAPMEAGYPPNLAYPPRGPTTSVTTTTTRTVVQQQPPAVIVSNQFAYRDVPVSMLCPVCKTQIITATEFSPGSLSILACFGLAAVGCCLGCCFIPFCIDDMKDVTHSCPNCRTVLGEYHRM